MTLRAKVIFAFMLCIFITNLTTATLGYFQNKSSLINHLLNVELPVKITLEKNRIDETITHTTRTAQTFSNQAYLLDWIENGANTSGNKLLDNRIIMSDYFQNNWTRVAVESELSKKNQSQDYATMNITEEGRFYLVDSNGKVKAHKNVPYSHKKSLSQLYGNKVEQQLLNKSHINKIRHQSSLLASQYIPALHCFLVIDVPYEHLIKEDASLKSMVDKAFLLAVLLAIFAGILVSLLIKPSKQENHQSYE